MAVTIAPPIPELRDPAGLLEELLDPGSMRVIRSTVSPVACKMPDRAGDGVLGAAGTVAGRPVFAYAHDGTFAAGAMGQAGADTILRILDLADRAETPVIAYIWSAGARLQEGPAALGAYGRVFRAIVRLRRRVPQIAVITGTSAGGGAYSPALMDWVVMVRDSAMFLTGPAVVKEAIGEAVGMHQLGGSAVHARTGVADLVAQDCAHATSLVHKLLGLLGEAPAVRRAATPEVQVELAELVPIESHRVYDIRNVIRGVADGDSTLELSPRWAPSMVTTLCRLDGYVTGFLANQPYHRGGVIDAASSEKAANFIDTCDAYDIPLVVLVDTAGFMPGSRQEQAGVIKEGADLIRAFVESSVPRVTVILRKAYGGAYISMNSKDLGAHFVFAWPSAEIGVMAARTAASILEHRADHPDAAAHEAAVRERAELYREQHVSAAAAARVGLVDEVIAPSATRDWLCWAFSVLRSRDRGCA